MNTFKVGNIVLVSYIYPIQPHHAKEKIGTIIHIIDAMVIVEFSNGEAFPFHYKQCELLEKRFEHTGSCIHCGHAIRFSINRTNLNDGPYNMTLICFNCHGGTRI